MTSVTPKLADVRARVTGAARRFGRDPAGLHVLAVSKGQTAAAIRAAFAEGQRDFGENYVQEAAAKMDVAWRHLASSAGWGQKTPIRAEADWCQPWTGAAERLSRQRPCHAAVAGLHPGTVADTADAGVTTSECRPRRRSRPCRPGPRPHVCAAGRNGARAAAHALSPAARMPGRIDRGRIHPRRALGRDVGRPRSRRRRGRDPPAHRNRYLRSQGLSAAAHEALRDRSSPARLARPARHRYPVRRSGQ